RIGKRALRNNMMVGLAGAAFVAIFVFGIPFPWVVATAALVGYAGNRVGLAAFAPGSGHGPNGKGAAWADKDSLLGEEIPPHARPSTARVLRVAVLWTALWLAPVFAAAYAGAPPVFVDIGVFFSKAAVVTFGGAYSVLAYVAQAAVDTYHWLRPGEMLDGLGMAETTPGPLITVLQFVGFMAAYRNPGALDPLMAATLGGMLTSWVTFVPCFLWIFVGAPYIEALRGNKGLSAALSAITAAVVGVVLNLAVWFALHTLFHEVRTVPGLALDVPVVRTIDPWAFALSAAAMVAIFRFKVGMIPTLLACAGVGLILYVAGVI
ncbi:MAG TPA: chromate transporter, partial [Alphaproteobacteria bacterium]|nr:chromate transporter [Alphaproteobacteria bacterium]